MDQASAQSEITPPPVPPEGIVPEVPPSPFKKLIPFVAIAVILLLILMLLMVVSGKKGGGSSSVPTPTSRPTATPIIAPTLALVTQPVSTISATVIPSNIGRLAFIKDGDIYHSDFSTISLLAKNTTPAGDKLTWSSNGNFLAWRPKSTTATPSAVTVYNISDKTSYTVKPFAGSNGEVLDLAFSPDEKQLALILKDAAYRLSYYSIASSTSGINILNRNNPIKQILWRDNGKIIYSGDEGIKSVSVRDGTESFLVQKPGVLKMRLSSDGKKILYSTGNSEKRDLFIYEIDTNTDSLIAPIPAKADMGQTGLSPSILNNGFIPYAIFMPTGNSLIVGYRYLPNLPLVGIYSLKDKAFTAITPFALYDTDIMTDDFRLLGQRVENKGNSVSRQVSIFTLEDNAKFGLIRMIPDAYSPAFFGRGLLSSFETNSLRSINL